MPSLNRPNAPDRLPSSDFGNLFGRPRAIRGSDLGSVNSTPSPLTTPTNYIAAHRRALRTSESVQPVPAAHLPIASPSPLVARQRPTHIERQSYHSDANTASPRETISLASLSSEAPLIIEGEPTPLQNRIGPGSSSVASRRRPHGLADTQITPDVGNEQSPGKARSGIKWKREFSGPLFEIRIGRKDPSPPQSVQQSGEATPIPLLSQDSTIHLPLSHASSSSNLEAHDRSSNAASDQRLLPESRDSSEYLLLAPNKEGLYCRTKRALGLKHDPVLDPINNNPSSSRERTPTDNLLERVSSTLRFLPDNHRKTTSTTAQQSSATSVSNLSIAAPRWPRIMSRHGKIGLSTSSSIRAALMGKPPIHTPEPEALYTASDSHTYLAVNLTDDGVAFLPSEARRIHTPPLPTADATSLASGKSRGFFFDFAAPTSTLPERPSAAAVDDKGDDDARSRARPAGPAGPPRRGSDWYRVQMNAIEAEAPPSLSLSGEQLAAAVPEHLPNSPLCPRHPRHKSGGRGECPYHGRNPSVPREKDDGDGGDGSRAESPSPAPGEIWW